MPKRSPSRAKEPTTISVTLTAAADRPTLQYCSEVRDPWKALNQGLCAVVRVAQCDDAHYALEAGKFLIEYACNQIAIREAKRAETDKLNLPSRVISPRGSEREAILNELRGLYAKALGSSPIVEAVPEAESESSDR